MHLPLFPYYIPSLLLKVFICSCDCQWSTLQAGDLIVRPDLAATLEMIAANGADIFYNGSIAQSIVRTVNNSKVRGILTLEDLATYKALLQTPLQVDHDGEAQTSNKITNRISIRDYYKCIGFVGIYRLARCNDCVLLFAMPPFQVTPSMLRLLQLVALCSSSF